MFYVTITPSSLDIGRKFKEWANTWDMFVNYAWPTREQWRFEFANRGEREQFLTDFRMSNWRPIELQVSHDGEVTESWYINTPQGITG